MLFIKSSNDITSSFSSSSTSVFNTAMRVSKSVSIMSLIVNPLPFATRLLTSLRNLSLPSDGLTPVALGLLLFSLQLLLR